MENGNVATVAGPPNSIPKLIPADIEGVWTASSGDAYKEIMALFGTQDKDALTLLMTQLVSATGCEDRKEHGQVINRVIPLLEAIGPKNELEAMLAIQMISVHCAAMEMTKRAMRPRQTVEGANNNINLATKLNRTFIAQMDGLNKHRGKGKQKITVEHVTVNSGGKAIVGNINQGGEGSGRKK